MCGILAATNVCAEDEPSFKAALLKQYHRGPDSQKTLRLGKAVMGFARLSIIDLSIASMQPFINRHITLVMNGEIYNYKELRHSLECEGAFFLSHGDAEVLAAAIAYWGPEKAFSKARGMWACVAYDQRTGDFIVSRDRVGIKPLWWANTSYGLVFASEIKSLLLLDPSLKELDWGTATAFVTNGVLDENGRSFFKRIRSFPEGHVAFVKPNDQTIKPSSFWKINQKFCKQENRLEDLRACLRETVALHMQSDVPVGLTLSGGIDSTILCHEAMRDGNLLCYSLRHPAADPETPLIDETVRLWNLKHTYVSCAAAETIGFVDELLTLLDQPFRATQTLYQYAIRKVAAEDGVRVLITGDGADEVFGGYTEGIPHAIAGLLKQEKLLQAEQMAVGMSEFTGETASALLLRASVILADNNTQKNPVLRVPKFDCSHLLSVPAAFNRFDECHFPTSNLKEYLVYRLQKTPLPYWLRVEDGTSMGTSIETRVPFLDHVLIEAVFSWPEEEFLAGFQNKSLLRRVAASILPKHISNQAKKYPRPGSAKNLIFKILSNDVLSIIKRGDPTGVLDTQACFLAFSNDLDTGRMGNADFWFRVFLYLRWAQIFHS